MTSQKLLFRLLSFVLLTAFLIGWQGCGYESTQTVPPPAVSQSESKPDAAEKLPGSSAVPKNEGLLDQKIADALKEIEQHAAAREKNVQSHQSVQDLIYQKKFAEATDAALKISDLNGRDSLLEDIARLQLADIMKNYKAEEKSSLNILTSETVLTQIPQVVQTVRLITDPVRRNKSFQNVAMFRLRFKDKEGAVQTLRLAADLLLQSDTGEIRKAKGLVDFAQWFLRENLKDEASPLLQTAESLLKETAEPFAAAMLFLELSLSYTLLNQMDKARETCEKAEQRIPKIPVETLRAAVMLRLSETLFTVRMLDPKISLAEQLSGIKQSILAAAKTVKTLPAVEEPTVKEENTLGLPLLSRTEMLHKKDELLRKIAEMQAWGTSLEEVQQTLNAIDSMNERDAVLTATVKMLLATGKTEDAQIWAEKITDPKIKKLMLEKIQQK